MELNKIYNMDCLEGMRQIPDNYIDLILTDPPYGINIGSKIGGNKPFGSNKVTVGGESLCKVKEYTPFDDRKIPSREVFEEMFRISKNQIIFGGNYFVEYLKNSPCWIVWDKDNTGNFADCELAWTSFPTSVRKFKHRWNGMLQENMKWKDKREHPTQKPNKLFRDIIKKYSKEGDIICDPFLGSGTTVIACKQLNRKFIGFEIIKKYYDITNRRLQQDNLGDWF